MSAKSKLRIYAAADVANHINKGDCWVIRNGKVYNVSEFAADHPGGDDLIFKYAGQDVGEIMKDSSEHDHSQSAYDMLGEYLVGKIGANANIVDESGFTFCDSCLRSLNRPNALPLCRLGGTRRFPPRRNTSRRGLRALRVPRLEQAATPSSLGEQLQQRILFTASTSASPCHKDCAAFWSRLS
jgi:hypothetical protein